MYKFWQGIIKEFKLLTRDIGGLVILFVMPIILVSVVTKIQDSTFQNISSQQVPVLIVDQDRGTLSSKVKSELESNDSFRVIDSIDGNPLSEAVAEQKVLAGSAQIAIVLPKDLTEKLTTSVFQNVSQILDELGMNTAIVDSTSIRVQDIKVIFDPTMQESFKRAFRGQIDKIVAQMESEMIYANFQQQLGGAEANFSTEPTVRVTEVIPHQIDHGIKPNSVQHNVPAWSLFAIFFIVVPLSINIVKEKSQGTYLRLLSSPTSNLSLYGSKMVLFLMISLLQFYSILLVAKLIFPYFGLPELLLTTKMFILMSVMTIPVGMAAVSISILLGILCRTQEQSAPFGATLVIILAALGGVWIPVFSMSTSMQIISKFSPMNWALQGYYDIILRNAEISDIVPEMLLLTLFASVISGIALIYDKKTRTI